MQVIARHGSCRVHDIADELSMTVGGTSKLVDRIEASGYCKRSPNPGDRRSSVIELHRRRKRAVLAEAAAVFEEEAPRSSWAPAMIAAIEFRRPRPSAGRRPSPPETSIARMTTTPTRRPRSDDRHHARGRSRRARPGQRPDHPPELRPYPSPRQAGSSIRVKAFGLNAVLRRLHMRLGLAEGVRFPHG